MNKRKFSMLILAGTMMLSTSLFAYSDTASGKLDDGTRAYGVVSLGSSRASASTRSSNTAACYASVEYTYQFGTEEYTEYDSDSDLDSTVATAVADSRPAENIMAEGTHKVSRNGDTWRGHTVEYNKNL